MKRDLIWFAAAVAIPLALSVINANAQCADPQPRFGETTAEYTARCVLPELRGIRKGTDSIDNTLAEHERIAKQQRDEAERIAKEQRARVRRAHQIECNRLSQRAALNWSQSAARFYEDYCTD